jgi:TolB protein
MRVIVSLGLVALHTAVVVLIVTAARELPSSSEIVAFSASGGATQDLFLQDVSRGLVRNLTGFTGSHHETQPVWSPDGMQLVFASAPHSFAPTDLYVIGIDGRGLRQLTHSAESEFAASWSPDGDAIVFTHFEGGIASLYRIDANGENIRRFSDGENLHANPAWSPDGRTIAFLSLRDGEPGIYMMASDGIHEPQLILPGNVIFTWSPNGSQLAFITGSFAIGLVNVEDGKVVQLELPGYQTAVTWLADGNRLAYLSYPCDLCNPEIYVRDMDSGETHLFTGGIYGSALPAWRPG